MRIETLDGDFHARYRHGQMKIAAAVIGGAGLIGSAVSGYESSSAAGDQQAAANRAADLQQQQYQQTRQDQAPYRQAGVDALNQIGTDRANGTGYATPFNFTADPGYQFQLQQGQNAIQSSAAARGTSLSGGTLKALDQYTTGLANTTYGDAYNRYLATSQQKYQQLFGVAQLGQQATQATGNAGTNAANASGNYLTQAGNASAAGDIGVGNAVNSGLSNIGLLGYAGLQQNRKAASQSSYAPYGANSD